MVADATENASMAVFGSVFRARLVADGYRTFLSRICYSRRLPCVTCIAVPCDCTATLRKVPFSVFETASDLGGPASLALAFRRRLETFYFLQATRREINGVATDRI